MAAHAARFGRDRYRREMESTLATAWAKHQEGIAGE